MAQQAMPGQGDQCIYCQLIENPDQLMKVGETENFFAWLEVQPRARGHTQIVPKEHIESVMDFSPEEYHEAMTLIREVVEKAEKGLGADGASVTINIKEAAGQMMPHAYISVFPRFQENETAGTPTGAIFQHIEELQDESKLKEIKNEMESIDVDFGVETKEPHPQALKHQERSTEKKSDDDQSENEQISKENKTDKDYGTSYEWV